MTLYYSSEQQECPHCGKIMRVFLFGAMLTPKKAAILDLIAKRPGIRAETITDVLFGGETSVRNVRVHICQINDALAHTDYVIQSRYRALRGGQHGPPGYRLIKQRIET